MFNIFKSRCPYCGFVFEKKPVRSRKCEQCGNTFFVKSGKLITKKEKIFLELFLYTSNYGVSEQMIRCVIESFGTERKFNDYRWSLFNEQILKEKAGKTNHERLANIYMAMAGILQDEGKDSSKIQELSDYHFEKSFQI
jgi:transposase-like protein